MNVSSGSRDASGNRQVVLRSRPSGVAQASNFEIIHSEIPSLIDGQIRVRNRFLSVEPAMRGWIADQGSYSDPVAIGAVMRALAVGDIVETRHADYQIGQTVMGWFGWQEQAVVEPSAILQRVTHTDLPASLALGVLGINGITAHLALTSIGEPRAGDTVVVSTAAGAVGSAVGQIAKLLGCRTVGIAGGPNKVDQCLSVFGFDAAIDYKSADIAAALAETCPNGIDVYFDNTAGSISDAVYPHLKIGARVVICGTASIATWDPWPSGQRHERHLLVKRARAQGFVIFDHMERWEESSTQLADWVRTGKLRYVEDTLQGLESCPDALAGLYRGENRGKRIVCLDA